MTWPQSRNLSLAVRAAATFHGTNPSDLLLSDADRKRIGKRRVRVLDRKLKMAWQILKDETCQRCGTPIWLGHNPDNWIEIKVEEIACFSCASLERHQEDQSKSKIKRHGITAFPKVGLVEGAEMAEKTLPGRNEFYEYMELVAQKRREQSDQR